LKSALLFDLDGTLVESDPLHFVAFQEAFAPFGVTVDEDQYRRLIMGAPNSAIGEAFLPHLPIAEREKIIDAKEAAFRRAFQSAKPTKGIVALLDFAETAGFAVALVTNAPRANAELMLATLGLAERFPLLVIGAELPRSKPDPLPYLTALQLTGAEAACSIAFEDSLSGIRAAAAAGLAVVGLTTGLDEATLIGVGATFGVADFTDPRIADLIAARTGSRPRRDIVGEIA
jgi:HAD superfamily hydrolase (TIGR01509 family)